MKFITFIFLVGIATLALTNSQLPPTNKVSEIASKVKGKILAANVPKSIFDRI
jgi:hypothetical protein